MTGKRIPWTENQETMLRNLVADGVADAAAYERETGHDMKHVKVKAYKLKIKIPRMGASEKAEPKRKGLNAKGGAIRKIRVEPSKPFPPIVPNADEIRDASADRRVAITFGIGIRIEKIELL